uniref:Pyrophosphate--fructose 6-phosphate 1-phosphotransferase n=1 Tax=Arundo donax TaxID=35708 RepID=A0A0A8YLV8_ARUDO
MGTTNHHSLADSRSAIRYFHYCTLLRTLYTITYKKRNNHGWRDDYFIHIAPKDPVEVRQCFPVSPDGRLKIHWAII